MLVIFTSSGDAAPAAFHSAPILSDPGQSQRLIVLLSNEVFGSTRDNTPHAYHHRLRRQRLHGHLPGRRGHQLPSRQHALSNQANHRADTDLQPLGRGVDTDRRDPLDVRIERCDSKPLAQLLYTDGKAKKCASP